MRGDGTDRRYDSVILDVDRFSHAGIAAGDFFSIVSWILWDLKHQL